MNLRALAHPIELVRHSAVRRQAERWLETEFRPGTIVFLCHGNQCRSPFAAALFSRSVPNEMAARVHVVSAGFVGVDRPAPPEAITAAARFDVDLSRHRSRVVTPELIDKATLVVAASPELGAAVRARFVAPDVPILVLGDLDPARFVERTIRDPMNGSPEVFRSSYERIQRCVRALAEHVTWPSDAASTRYT